MSELPDPDVLRWAAAVTGSILDSIESLHPYGDRGSGSYLLRMVGDAATTGSVVLKIPVRDWIDDGMVVTNARALELAASLGIPAPHLIAADLDGRASGTVATLETMLAGSSTWPPPASVARLEAAGAAFAKVHAHALVPQDHLPYRPRPVAVDDFAGERRHGRMETTPLLRRADEQTRDHPASPGRTVFVHGDASLGNLLWTGDTGAALIDWKTAGAGRPGVDLAGLRLQAALRFGPDAPDHVRYGWEREAGRPATEIPYWDAIAALNTPTELHGWPGFADDGSRLGPAAVTGRRDQFLESALDQLSH